MSILIYANNKLEYYDHEYRLHKLKNIYENIYCSLPIFSSVQYTKNNILYTGRMDSRFREIKDEILVLNLEQNNVEKCIHFGETNKYTCFIDKNGDIYLKEHNNDFIKIGNITEKYEIFVEDYNLIIVQKGKIMRVNIMDKSITKIECPINITKIQEFTFDDYIWSKNTHKLINNYDKKIIESFILCNKYKGQFKINYFVLSLIFTHYSNTK